MFCLLFVVHAFCSSNKQVARFHKRQAVTTALFTDVSPVSLAGLWSTVAFDPVLFVHLLLLQAATVTFERGAWNNNIPKSRPLAGVGTGSYDEHPLVSACLSRLNGVV